MFINTIPNQNNNGYGQRVSQGAWPLSWPAIVAGTLIATAIKITLAILCITIASSLYAQQYIAIELGSLLLVVTLCLMAGSIAALFIGGWITTTMARCLHRSFGALHGCLVWALSVILLCLFLISLGQLLLGASVVFPVLDVNNDFNQKRVLTEADYRYFATNVPSVPSEKAPALTDSQRLSSEFTSASHHGQRYVARISGICFLLIIIGAGSAILGGCHGVSINNKRLLKGTHLTTARNVVPITH
jgi:hypothetical protein